MDPRGHHGVDHHRGAERGVRRSERGPDVQRGPSRDAGKHDGRQQRAQAHAQGQPDSQQPQIEAEFRAQGAEGEPGGVREEHPDQGDLREYLHGLVREREVEDAGALAQQQPQQDERGRSGQLEALHPP